MDSDYNGNFLIAGGRECINCTYLFFLSSEANWSKLQQVEKNGNKIKPKEIGYQACHRVPWV